MNIKYRNILEKRLKEGIANNKFVIYLQPKFYTKTEKLAGAEALVRWNRDGDVVMPNIFVPLLEKYELITELDTYVLESICKLQQNWEKKGYKIFPISVNESRLHLYNKNHINDLIDFVNKYSIKPNTIELEMTETSVVNNVELAKEAEKFTIGMQSIVVHGTLEERKNQIASIPNYDIVITSYELLKRDIEEYKKYDFKFKYIIADEAQYIKNNNTQNAKAIKNISAETRFALTGTPIENSLSELWSIFDFIMPGYLFGYRKFKELYETPIIKEGNEVAMNKLKKLIEPFVLRRIKGEVLTELPDKMISVLNSQMVDEQRDIYLSYLAKAKKNAMEEIQENGIEKSQIKILALLTRLRQICCHPSLFIDNYKGESGKLNQCIEIVKDAIQSGHKILLFSGYTAMFEIIEKELQKENIEFLKLTGQTKVSERINLVDEFNSNPNKKLFLISLKAGGTGLNLVGADVVIHYDPWWNLSAENQATDRTYRIGQKRNVQVYKLITKNSIEEKIYELQKRKETLIDSMLSTNQTFISKLSKEDIMNLFE